MRDAKHEHAKIDSNSEQEESFGRPDRYLKVSARATGHKWQGNRRLQCVFARRLTKLVAAGIQAEVVRAVAASRYFSMLGSAQGEVWAFGGGFNGELGFASSSWVTSAQKVEGELAKVILHTEVRI